MALKGEQFHNTYMPGRPDWMSPEHHTRQGPKHLTDLHSAIPLSPSLYEPVTDDEITTFDISDEDALGRRFGGLQVISDSAPAPPEELLPGTQRQGMLFDPYTGTGLPRDPLVGKEQRLAAVDHQLDLRGQGAPQLRETYAMGDEPISEFYRPIVRSTHGDKGEEADKPTIKQGRGRRGGGHYQSRSNEATVQTLGQKTFEYKTRSLTRPTKDATSIGTVWNPEWYTGGSTGRGKGIIPKGGKPGEGGIHGEISKEILKHSFHNPETGVTLNPHTGPSEPVFLPWSEETPEEIASSRRYGNRLYVDMPSDTSRLQRAGRKREVTGTRGEADEYQHLGVFNPSTFSDTGYVQDWDAADALEQLHKAGFQSELHRGTGKTEHRSLIPPDPAKVATGEQMDRPQREYIVRADHGEMLPTKDAEGFLTKGVFGGEKYSEGYGMGRVASHDLHKRRIPSETETVERKYEVETVWPDASTAFHERAHAIDPSIGHRTKNRGDSKRWHIDPVMEGVADAATDRTIEYANVHEDALNPSLNPNRAADVKDGKSRRGYGSENEAWKKDPLTQAIYSATRIHSAMSDEPNVPDRVELVMEQHGKSSFNIASQENTDLANETLLGKLYHENKHVRDGLNEIGFSRIGSQAAEKHVRRMDDAAQVAYDNAPDETQLSFWPRQGVNE